MLGKYYDVFIRNDIAWNVYLCQFAHDTNHLQYFVNLLLAYKIENARQIG